MGAALHFHHMRHDVNGAGMPGIDCQRPARKFFGAAILPVLFESKRVHRQHAGITRHLGRPIWQHPGDTIARRAPAAKMEIKCVRDRKRKHVLRIVGQDGVVKCCRTSRIAIEPGARAATA